MSYSDFLKPRPETISDEGVEGIIDLANLYSGHSKKIESNPEAFFGLTYPTSDILKVLEEINLRFSSDQGTSGLFLFEGLKGSGKSHLLLLVHNLFKHPDIANAWLTRNGIKCSIPNDFIVVINKFTDNPHDAIWNMIFGALGVAAREANTHPKLEEFLDALGNKKVILIFDELEQGIKVISDAALQAQNVAFLQVLSEPKIHHLFPHDPCCCSGWAGFLKNYPKNGIPGRLLALYCAIQTSQNLSEGEF